VVQQIWRGNLHFNEKSMKPNQARGPENQEGNAKLNRRQKTGPGPRGATNLAGKF
jgi:hypothetical protein